MPADAKKRARKALQTLLDSPKEQVPTAWDVLERDDILDPPEPPVDFTGAIYPKKPRPSRRMDPYNLKKLPTRVLLRYLAAARAVNFPSYDDGPGVRPEGFDPCDGNKFIEFDDIKAELAKRPHIPSKREGSKLRQSRVEKKHGTGKRGGTPRTATLSILERLALREK